MIPDPEGYLRTWAKEFSAKANRVRHLIGAAHWLSDGHHKESILREFLTRYLPTHIEVSRGFIRGGSTHSEVSGEIDVMLTDSSRHAAFLSEHGLTICPPDAVRAHIEVKSQLDSSNLKKALESIINTNQLIFNRIENPDTWSCAFFYNMSESPQSIKREKTLRTAIQDVVYESAPEVGIAPAQLLPSCIVCVDKLVAFLALQNNCIKVRQFDVGELSAALALLDMFDCLRTSTSPGGRSDFEQLIAGIECEGPKTFDIDLEKGK